MPHRMVLRSDIFCNVTKVCACVAMAILTRAPPAVRIWIEIHTQKRKKNEKTLSFCKDLSSLKIICVFPMFADFFQATEILTKTCFFFSFFRFLTRILIQILTACGALVRIFRDTQANNFVMLQKKVPQKVPSEHNPIGYPYTRGSEKPSKKSAKKGVPASLDLRLLYRITFCEINKILLLVTRQDSGEAKS